MRTKYIEYVNQNQPNHLMRPWRSAHHTQASLSIFTDDSIALCEAAPVPLVSAGGKTSLEREILEHHTPVKDKKNDTSSTTWGAYWHPSVTSHPGDSWDIWQWSCRMMGSESQHVHASTLVQSQVRKQAWEVETINKEIRHCKLVLTYLSCTICNWARCDLVVHVKCAGDIMSPSHNVGYCVLFCYCQRQQPTKTETQELLNAQVESR